MIGCASSTNDPRGTEFEKSNKRYRHYIVDVSKESDVRKFFTEIKNFNIAISLIFNCAGTGFAPRIATEFCEVEAKRVLEVNLIGTAFILKYGLPVMEKNGTFVVCGSISADRAGTGADAMYGASKAGLRPLLRQVAEENKETSFLYANLGYIETRMTATDDKNAWRSRTPYGKSGTPEETAKLLLQEIESHFGTGYFECEVIGGDYPTEKSNKKQDRTRKAGILLSVTSLPNAYSCGSFGSEAYEFIDALKIAAIRTWTMLPIQQTGYSNSPYMALSAIGGSLNLISPALLYEEGLLSEEEHTALLYSGGNRVDYGECYVTRPKMIRQAYQRFFKQAKAMEKLQFYAFCEENREWLEDYAIYLSAKLHWGGKDWQSWPDEELRLHNKKAIERYYAENEADVNAMKFSQYIFFKQFTALRDYANEQGVQIVGDIPFYVGVDSADVWANRDLFAIDEKGMVLEYGGIPNKNAPDTNWGCVCYNWKRHKEDGFAWWRQKIRFFSKLYDILRIDHAVGMFHYYAIPANGGRGVWKSGPDIDGTFTQMIANEVARTGTDVIFEDLGEVPVGLRERIQELGFCGMRILQYSYSNKYFANSIHLPMYFTQNTMCFTGTHDNIPLATFLEEKKDEELGYLKYMLNLNFSKYSQQEIHWAMIREAYHATARYCTIPMQDFLELGVESCMVNREKLDDSWTWRMESLEEFYKLSKKLHSMAILSGRLSANEQESKIALDTLSRG